VLRNRRSSSGYDDNDANSVSSGESVDDAAPFVDHLRSLARRVFGCPALRRRQEVAVTRLLFGEGKGKLLLVERTGGGKSLVLALTAAFVGGVVSGVVVVIVLPPALTAEQLARINRAVPWPGVDGLMPWIEHTHWPSRARSSVVAEAVVVGGVGEDADVEDVFVSIPFGGDACGGNACGVDA